MKPVSIFYWYRFLRTHHRWTFSQAIRGALWLAPIPASFQSSALRRITILSHPRTRRKTRDRLSLGGFSRMGPCDSSASHQ